MSRSYLIWTFGEWAPLQFVERRSAPASERTTSDKAWSWSSLLVSLVAAPRSTLSAGELRDRLVSSTSSK